MCSLRLSCMASSRSCNLFSYHARTPALECTARIVTGLGACSFILFLRLVLLLHRSQLNRWRLDDFVNVQIAESRIRIMRDLFPDLLPIDHEIGSASCRERV